jgi:casein kinase II subunit alpha
MKKDGRNPAVAPLFPRFLLLCALIALRATHDSIQRTTILSNNEETDTVNIIEISNRRGSMSKARVYTDVNVLRPKEYWDYESLTVQWG